jgi:hypothetical protein
MRPLYPVKRPPKLASSGGFFMGARPAVTFLGRLALLETGTTLGLRHKLIGDPRSVYVLKAAPRRLSLPTAFDTRRPNG